MQAKIDVIIPAFNEEKAIGKVIQAIPKNIIREIIVINNNSTDATAQVAEENGATVLNEYTQGYGKACLKGLAYLNQKADPPDIVVFMDGDFSDYPEEIEQLVEPIINKKADMVIGSRVLGEKEKGALQPQQVFGNWLATKLIYWIYKKRYTDLGPFRAISMKKLIDLEMKDTSYGWTVEMQVKAARKGLRYSEIPVKYRKRIGKSKIAGTLKGSILAGYKIIYTIFRNI